MVRSEEPRSVSFLRVGEAEFAVVSIPVAPRSAPDSLTNAEANVLCGILSGKSGREIAVERRTSVRTVANQVASVYRKLGVTSRTELVRAYRGAPAVTERER
jgi:DNA-binding NarL/FixJ family response regulator